MKNGYDTSPIYHTPLPANEFAYQQSGQLQNMMLSDDQMMREAIRHQQAIERDIHKSYLRNEEFAYKQQLKSKTTQITETRQGIVMSEITAQQQLIRQRTIFDCQIMKLCRFRRNGTDRCYWQLVLRSGNSNVISVLYPTTYLSSVCKLQLTVLGEYDCTVLANEKSMAWKWMRNRLISMYNEAEEVTLPLLPGWFEDNGVWHFWVRSEETALLASEEIQRFSTTFIPSQGADDIANELINVANQFTDFSYLGVLLIFRLRAFLGSLTNDLPSGVSLTLIGVDAVEIAKVYLRVMNCEDGNYDIVNLNSDRMNRIRENLKNLQDTPFIIVSSGAYDRSVQNRIAEVLSWMDSGYMEGTNVTIPFVFCLRELSPSYPLDNTVVLPTDGIFMQDDFTAFSKLQSFITLKIESGGQYWAEEFRNQYHKFKKEKKDEEAESGLFVERAIVKTVMKMLDLCSERYMAIQKVFQAGFDEINKQLSFKSGILLEIFKKQVCDLVDSNKAFVVALKTDFAKLEEKVIYYDDSYYYFTKLMLQWIGKQADLSRKAILFIKQRLAREDLVKQYRTTGSRRSELDVDIFISVAGNKEKVSAFAVKREFWDAMGGIALFERGNDWIENIV